MLKMNSFQHIPEGKSGGATQNTKNYREKRISLEEKEGQKKLSCFGSGCNNFLPSTPTIQTFGV
jgi:hypothetical protein